MSLKGKVCLVTGASRGVGKGIALELGMAGATVYITGRTLQPPSPGGTECLQATADAINASGGVGIPVECDHSHDKSTIAVFERIHQEQGGHLDLLVNNAFSGVSMMLATLGKPFWETGIELWDSHNQVGLRNAFLCSCEAAKLMVDRKQKDPNFLGGLIVNISSIGAIYYSTNVPYGVGKEAMDRMARDMAHELKPYGITAVALWPGGVETEGLQQFIHDNPNSDLMEGFSYLETTRFVGRVVVALMQDPQLHEQTGKVILTAEAASKYRVTDIDNRVILSMRSAKLLLSMFGWPRLAAICPLWLKSPYIFMTILGSRF